MTFLKIFQGTESSMRNKRGNEIFKKLIYVQQLLSIFHFQPPVL